MMDTATERTRKLSVEVEVPTKFLTDVLTVAVDGGINYWIARCDRVVRAEDLSVYAVEGIEVEGDDAEYNISVDTVQLGLHRLLRGSVQVNGSIRGHLFAAVSDLLSPDLSTRKHAAGEIDADAADCIVQAGLFGEIVYG